MANVYICGPITGLPDGNKPAFLDAQRKLEELGFIAINPHELCKDIVNEQMNAESIWKACMKRDIAEMLKADYVVLLPGWQNSRGAYIEAKLASEVGIKVMKVNMFLDQALQFIA